MPISVCIPTYNQGPYLEQCIRSVMGQSVRPDEVIVSNDCSTDESRATGTFDAVDEHLESSAEKVHPHPHDMEETVKPVAGEAVAAPADSTETRMTHEEMSRLGNAGECPFLMNRE